MAKKHTEENIFENAEIWNLGQIGKTDEEKKKKEEEDYAFLNLGDDPAKTSRAGGGGLKYSPEVKPRKRKKSALPILLLLAVVIGGSFLLAGMPSPKPSGVTIPVGTVYTEPSETAPTETAAIETAPPETTPPVIAPAETGSEYTLRYYGRQLPGNMGNFYLELAKNVAECAEVFNCRISFADAADGETLCRKLNEASNALGNDYCEFFWYNGASSYHYSQDDAAGCWNVEFTPVYRIDTAGIEEKKAFVEEAVRPFVEEHRYLTDWEKALAVYEYLIDITIYDYDYLGTTIYDFLSTGHGVCEGYARTACYILNQMDVETIYVPGVGTNSEGHTESHSWNILKINGVYCQMDATWGDPVNEDGSQTKNFKYFLLSDEQMYRDHTPDFPELLPVCSDTYEYYRVNNLLMEYYDELRMVNMVAMAADKTISFRVTNEAAYRQIMTTLFENNNFPAVYAKATGDNGYMRYNYWYDDTAWVITVIWD